MPPFVVHAMGWRRYCRQYRNRQALQGPSVRRAGLQPRGRDLEQLWI